MSTASVRQHKTQVLHHILIKQQNIIKITNNNIETQRLQ